METLTSSLCQLWLREGNLNYHKLESLHIEGMATTIENVPQWHCGEKGKS